MAESRKSRQKKKKAIEKEAKPQRKQPNWKNTSDIQIPPKIIDQVVGQENAVEIIKKAARQRRHVLLIGSPGTGKTMLAQAMAELLPTTELEDILVYKNPNDENEPIVKTVKTYPTPVPEGKLGDGQGRQMLQKERMKNRMAISKGGSIVTPIVMLLVIILVFLAFSGYITGLNLVVIAALILGIMVFGSVALFMTGLTRRVGMFPGMGATEEPKLIVDNTGLTHAPFVDGTGSKAGALFGDVRHDPLQCIPAGEKVILPNGNLVNVEKLVDQFFPQDTSGEREVPLAANLAVLGGADRSFLLSPTKVTKVYKRHYNGDLIHVKTRSGSTIKVTPNHPLATLGDDGQISYIDAGMINEQFRVIVPERINKIRTKYIPDNLLNFMADVLADGWLGERRVEFHLKREFKIDLIKDNIRSLGYIPKVNYDKDGSGKVKITLNSAELCHKLREFGMLEGKEKRIPDAIFGQDVLSIIAFLSRLLSLDGYVNKQGQFEILSSSQTFIKQVRALLFTLGINAKYKTRIDNGFGKEKQKVQHILRWNHFALANEYIKNTINPIHMENLSIYLDKTSSNKECFDDIIPLKFSILDNIRSGLNISKEAVHQDFWSLNPSTKERTNLTRNLLNKITNRFDELGANGNLLANIKALGQGDYAFDEILEIKREHYEGFVYNMTTENGNYLVDFVLTHNSGGLGTPAHLRVEGGAVHKANHGVLFIDEISRLDPKAQQDLLTAMQEKKYSITGQSELSSGAIVKTEPVPCDFILVAAGNLQDIQNMHPALRSRIRGYGYEVYMESAIKDTPTNEDNFVRFIAQEIKNDGRIPQFDKGAVLEIIEEAKRRSGRKSHLTLVLRDLGGLVRAAGDIAVEKKHSLVTREDVVAAKTLANPIETQVITQAVEYRKDYRVFGTRGYSIGKVNGLAVMGGSLLAPGIVMPIVAEVTPASSRAEGKFIPTGKLGKIATEAVKNVSAIIKKHLGRDVANYDMHVQFLQSYEGVEGDSASISVAISIISAMEGIPVDQSVAMTGSLSVRGAVLPVGGVTSKVEAAIREGIKTVILPASNADDVYITKEELKKIKIIPVRTLAEVMQHSLKKSKRGDDIIKELAKHTSVRELEDAKLE